MKYKLFIIVLFVSFFIAGKSFSATHIVSDGKVAVFIGQDNVTMRRYVQETGHQPAGFMIYISIQETEGLDSWSTDYGSGTCNADDLLEKYPGRAIQIGLYMVDALKPTHQGVYDANIERMARWMKAVKVPVFLRIGYEFDGPHNHYDPQEYKKAYIHIVDKLRAADVTNVDYVWHSFSNALVKDIAPWYPGDDYVDWVGLSYFDQPQDLMTHIVDFATARNKPLMIAEATPKNKRLKSSLAWKIWYQPFFRFVEMNGIKAISYINSH